MSRQYTAGPCETCGYVAGPSKTEGLAEFGLRSHSCDRQRVITERAARVAARKTSSGEIRDCHHPVANHQHGTHAAYVLDKCRCRPCRDASAAYEAHRSRQRAYGRQPYVDARPAREHVLELGRQGMGWKRVADAAHLERSVLWKILYGDPSRGMAPSRRVRPTTADKLLAVTLDLADGAIVDSTGTRRRLQALIAGGWSQQRIADRLGMSIGNLNTLIHGRRGGAVTVAKARAIRDLYDHLWDQAPPHANRWELAGISHARHAARRNGWVPALAWDDDSIDDPHAIPDLGEQAPRRAGRNAEHVVEDAAWFLGEVDGIATVDQVCHRLAIRKDALTVALRRAGRQDLLDQLARNAELAGHNVRRTA